MANKKRTPKTHGRNLFTGLKDKSLAAIDTRNALEDRPSHNDMPAPESKASPKEGKGRAKKKRDEASQKAANARTVQDHTWIAWNQDQTRVVAMAGTSAEVKEAARQAGEPEPFLENVEETRKRLADQYEGGEELCTKLLRAEGDLLNESEVARLLGLLPHQVEEWRSLGRLIAFPFKTRFAFPSWQFAGRRTLSGLEDVLVDLHRHNHHPLAELRFFLSPNARLNNQPPLVELRRGKIDKVRRAARAYGEHGAA